MSFKSLFESCEAFIDLNNSFLFDVELAPDLSFKVGGKADIVFEPKSVEQLQAGLKMFADLNLPVSIIGAGSNLLVSDSGIRGVVIKLTCLNKITVNVLGNDVFLEVGAGALTEDVSKFCATHSIAGFETFAGLPGSIGGAVFMNARCYDHSISEFFFSANIIQGFDFFQHKFDETEWAYKKSPFQSMPYGIELSEKRKIICSVVFKLQKGESNMLEAERNKYLEDRENKGHFRKPSAGSTFKNNRSFGKPSGRIIDELGLKGFSIGDAQVAPWHGNLIINNGNATARELRELIETVSDKVFEKSGFRLEREVVFAGDWS
ncbi:MAG: UDP-N-acetylenolpyruvoylglucosamine reductase [Treponema sp.]|nr:MAG: UDP-N-acetylenolpyruvoylglucosamine reductase [Treponema sp.]